jgi:hypothetical protein
MTVCPIQQHNGVVCEYVQTGEASIPPINQSLLFFSHRHGIRDLRLCISGMVGPDQWPLPCLTCTHTHTHTHTHTALPQPIFQRQSCQSRYQMPKGRALLLSRSSTAGAPALPPVPLPAQMSRYARCHLETQWKRPCPRSPPAPIEMPAPSDTHQEAVPRCNWHSYTPNISSSRAQLHQKD